MNPYITLCLIWILISNLVCSANNKKKDPRLYDSIPIQSQNKFFKDIPTNKWGKNPYYYENKPNVEKKFGLSSIEAGFDSIQIRLWYSYAFEDSSQLVILNNIAGKWSGEMFNFLYRYSNSRDSVLSISSEKTIKTPKSGWSSFTENLFSLNITKMLDHQKVMGSGQVADGDAIIIEVATKNMYRIYSYVEPGLMSSEFDEARTMEAILCLIEEEFDFPRLRKL